MKDLPTRNQRLREFLGQIIPIYQLVQNKNKKNLFFNFSFFQFSSKFTMPGSIFLKNDKFCVKSITDYMDPYFKLKPPDCYLYAEDGYKFDIHKVCLQIFFQFFFHNLPLIALESGINVPLISLILLLLRCFSQKFL